MNKVAFLQGCRHSRVFHLDSHKHLLLGITMLMKYPCNLSPVSLALKKWQMVSLNHKSDGLSLRRKKRKKMKIDSNSNFISINLKFFDESLYINHKRNALKKD